MNVKQKMKELNPNYEMLTHDEKFSLIVNFLGIENVSGYIPFSKKQIKEAFENGDIHLNSCPLRFWDRQVLYIKNLLCSNGINACSLAESVCILKECARMNNK
jgi:hypothetical protein